MGMPKYATAGIIVDIMEDFDAASNVVDGGGVMAGKNLGW